LLVVDAGTVLSLNRIARSGRFIGGRLLAGDGGWHRRVA
jgi:pantothenate kinase type III